MVKLFSPRPILNMNKYRYVTGRTTSYNSGYLIFCMSQNFNTWIYKLSLGGLKFLTSSRNSTTDFCGALDMLPFSNCFCFSVNSASYQSSSLVRNSFSV